MQRLLTLLLLFVLGLPSVAPVFAMQVSGVSTGDGQLPACCRRGGQHQCSMTMAERRSAEKRTAASRVRTVSAPLTPCPFCPRTLIVSAQGPLFAPPPAAALHSGNASARYRARIPAGTPAPAARPSVARGPPPSLLA